jgi:hypothetical protein
MNTVAELQELVIQQINEKDYIEGTVIEYSNTMTIVNIILLD